MKNKLIISSVIVVVLILLVVLEVIYSFDTVESVVEKKGTFSDETGKRLGYCTIESTMKKIGTEPSYKTFYYDLNETLLGYCNGDSYGSFPGVKEKQPEICNPLTFQNECDRSIYSQKTYPFCVKAKYKCALN